MDPETRQYDVLEAVSIGGQDYLAGDKVELTEDVAAAYVESGNLQLSEAATVAPEAEAPAEAAPEEPAEAEGEGAVAPAAE